MANNVVVNVTANNNTQSGLNAAQGSVSSFSDQVGGMMAGGGAVAGGLFAAGLSSAMDISSAQTSLETQFGLTGQAAERAGDIAGDVFKAGFGGSVGDVTNAIGSLQTSIGDLGTFTDTEIKKMSESALGLSKTFGVDVNEATSAVGQMIKTGLVKDAEQGFDIITKTMQTVPAHLRDDILPTIQEYGTQFRKVGLDGSDAMGLISQGLKAGARDADIVADSIKEFSIRAVDGSKLTGESFKALGLDSEKMASMIAKGGEDGKKGLDLTLDALRKVKDPVEQSRIAVGLFGTQAEDMGEALYALDPSAAAAATGMDKAKGSAEGMTEKMEASPAQQLDSALRTLQETLGEYLLPVIQEVGSFLKDHKEEIEQWAPLVLGLGTAFATASIGVWAMNSALLANPIFWIVAAIIAIVILLIVYWDDLKAAAGVVWEKIKEAWNKIKEKTGELWDTVKEKFNRVKDKWTEVKDKAKETKDKIKGYWEDFIGFFRGIPGRVRAIASGMWGSMVGGLKGALNNVIQLLNDGVYYINDKLIYNANRLPGVDIPYIPYIPYLATGGLVSGGRGNQVIVGEYGPEMVTLPSGSHVSTASRTAQLLRGGGGGGGEMHITLKIGEKTLGDILVDPIRGAVRSRGGNVQAVLGR